MMMLFNTKQYEQPLKQSYRGDWDDIEYDPTWDELDDIPEIRQNEGFTVVEVIEYDFVSVPSQFLEDKLSEDISSRKIGENEEFLEDKLSEDISSRKIGENQKFLEDKSGEHIFSRKMGKNEKFLEDKSDEHISSRKMGENEEFLEDNSGENISSKKTRRRKGDGSGCIYYRTVAKKGKEYCEAYYQYEVWKDGDRLVKSSKYIPKRLLIQVQRLEVEKAPVKKTLEVLGINC
ncbi:MAG: hypothetical protein HC815_37970 [Richelia sp. RM1_1_1]|nr:hypothetical protein [Richelia sp. RM1_1_1]